nr:hypothetical protein [Azospirillum oryzae]
MTGGGIGDAQIAPRRLIALVSGELLGDRRRRDMGDRGDEAGLGVVEAVLQPHLLQRGPPSPLRVLHRLALPLRPMLVGQQVGDPPFPRLPHQVRQQLHRLRIGRDELGTVGLGRGCLKPNPTLLKIDLVDGQPEHLRLAEPHQAGQQHAVAQMRRRGRHDRLEIAVRNRAGQVLRLRQLGHLRQLGQQQAAGAVAQRVGDSQRFPQSHQIAVDGRVGAVAIGRMIVLQPLFRRARLRPALVDHHRLRSRPGDVFPDPLFGQLGHRGFRTEEVDEVRHIDTLVRPVLQRLLARGIGDEHLRDGEDRRRGRRRLGLEGCRMHQRLASARFGLVGRRLPSVRIDAVTAVSGAIESEVVAPAIARLVMENGHVSAI